MTISGRRPRRLGAALALGVGGSTTFGMLGSGTAPTALTGLQCTAH